MPDNDKMLVVRETLLKLKDEVNSTWLKKNPTFFMALHDSDLYEPIDGVMNVYMSIFKSTTTIDNFIKALMGIDSANMISSASINKYFKSNLSFRKKFYRFFARLVAVASTFRWLPDSRFETNYDYKTKNALVDAFIAMVFSTTSINDSITHEDCDTFATNIVNGGIQMTMKKYVIDNASYDEFLFPAQGDVKPDIAKYFI